MRPLANESDDDEALEVDRPPPRELTEWEQADRAAAARAETREREEAAAAAAEAAAAELRIVGGCARERCPRCDGRRCDGARRAGSRRNGRDRMVPHPSERAALPTPEADGLRRILRARNSHRGGVGR